MLQPELEEATAALYPRATKTAELLAQDVDDFDRELDAELSEAAAAADIPAPTHHEPDFDDFDRELAALLGEELSTPPPAAPLAAPASDAELDEEMEEVEVDTTATPPQRCSAGGPGAEACAANAALARGGTAAAEAETKTAASGEDRAVIELSARNLEATITDESKHVLLMFYAPWCSVST